MSNPRVPIFAMAAAAIALAAALSCGGSSSSPSPPSGVCTPSANPNTLVLMNNSICPQTLTVSRGSQLTIMNQDSNTHEMNSDPHPEHTDCPELNQIGFLSHRPEPLERQPEHRAPLRDPRSQQFHPRLAEGDDYDPVARGERQEGDKA